MFPLKPPFCLEISHCQVSLAKTSVASCRSKLLVRHLPLNVDHMFIHVWNIHQTCWSHIRFPANLYVWSETWFETMIVPFSYPARKSAWCFINTQPSMEPVIHCCSHYFQEWSRWTQWPYFMVPSPSGQNSVIPVVPHKAVAEVSE